MKINNEERKQWVKHEGTLHTWWKTSKLPLQKFISKNTSDIDEIIKRTKEAKKYLGVDIKSGWQENFYYVKPLR